MEMSFLWSESIFLHFLLSFHSVLCKVPVMGNFKKKYELFQENRKYCKFLVFWQKNIHVGKLKKKISANFFFFLFSPLNFQIDKTCGVDVRIDFNTSPVCVFYFFSRDTQKFEKCEIFWIIGICKQNKPFLRAG